MEEVVRPRLELRELSKSFGGTQALRGVDLSLLPGEVHGLLGENGSGKSTLIKVLAGFHDPDGGELLIDGRPVLFDAIEFSPLIASGDVLYDLAFLLMDLTERGLGTAANIVLNRYLREATRAEDPDALAALP